MRPTMDGSSVSSRQTNVSGAKNYNRHRSRRRGEERKHDWCRRSMKRNWSSPVMKPSDLLRKKQVVQLKKRTMQKPMLGR
jgi:hypothetical protein